MLYIIHDLNYLDGNYEIKKEVRFNISGTSNDNYGWMLRVKNR